VEKGHLDASMVEALEKNYKTVEKIQQQYRNYGSNYFSIITPWGDDIVSHLGCTCKNTLD